MFVTTSRKASSKSIQLAKDLSKSLSPAFYKPRGRKALEAMIGEARYFGARAVLIVSESHGNPSELKQLRLSEDGWEHGKTLKFSLKKLRRELSPFKSKMGSLSASGLSPKIKSFFEDSGTVFSSSSENRAVQSKGCLTFFRGAGEVGPQLKLKGFTG